MSFFHALNFEFHQKELLESGRCTRLLAKPFGSHSLALFYNYTLIADKEGLFDFHLPVSYTYLSVDSDSRGIKKEELFTNPFKHQICSRKKDDYFFQADIPLLRGFRIQFWYYIEIKKCGILIFSWRTPKISHRIACKVIPKCLCYEYSMRSNIWKKNLLFPMPFQGE